MADGYTKLFASITDSTIWEAPDTTRLVWITMLAMADQDGYVGASVPGLAARARVSLEDCVKALDTFREPDEWSRSKDFDGRRIVDADGGWILLNHGKYRAIRDAEARREQARLAMARLRAERKAVTDVNDVSHGCPSLAHTEAEATTDKAKSKADASPSGSRLPSDWTLPDDWREWAEAERPELDIYREACGFADFWHAKAGKDARKVDWKATWRNWIRNSRNSGVSNGSHSRSSAVDRVRANAIAGEAADRAKSDRGADLVGSHD